MVTERFRGRPREFDRDQALAKAMKRFWLLGFDATSMRHLAEAMAISQPSLYACFGSKAALYVQVVGAFEEEVAFLDMSAVTTASSLSKGLDRMLDDLVRRITKSGSPKGCLILGGQIADVPGQRHLVLHLRARRRAYQAALSVALETWLPLKKASATAAVVTIFARGLSDQARDGDTAALLRQSVEDFGRHATHATETTGSGGSGSGGANLEAAA